MQVFLLIVSQEQKFNSSAAKTSKPIVSQNFEIYWTFIFRLPVRSHRADTIFNSDCSIFLIEYRIVPKKGWDLTLERADLSRITFRSEFLLHLEKRLYPLQCRIALVGRKEFLFRQSNATWAGNNPTTLVRQARAFENKCPYFDILNSIIIILCSKS